MATADARTKRSLPSGFVTFMFTDIEGSTRLYKALGEEAAGDVFDVHNEVIREVLAVHHGHEIHTEGDSFFIAFERPVDAVATAINIQRRIDAVVWPEDGEVKVRIGIHAGLGAPRNGDYMALAVHQAARVMSAAHGNQILITESTLERIEDHPDLQASDSGRDGISDGIETGNAQRIGAFRLRDFEEPPVLYRVDPDGLAPTEQPLRATPANHHNLVRPLTSFIGRDADLVAVNRLLEPGKVVSLVGLGGMGKTRLATEVGLEVEPTWEGGVWMVELAEVADPELIIEEIASSIGLDSSTSGDRQQAVLDYVGEQSLLMIIDNVEHLIDSCSLLVPELLRACPNLAVLCTSREPLNCTGEVIYRLQPLDLPTGEQTADEDPRLLPAVELFIDRASAVSRDMEWTPEALREAVQVCGHLDGLPLAIEIAAAQVRVLQLPEIREGLSNRFRLLRSRDRALPDRQRTMEGLLGWSYRLLTDTEQRALRRLAVFGGSFSRGAAEAALAGDGIDADDVPELIWALVDKSLIAADLSDSATRYRLFESVQEYAMRLLIDNDDPLRVSVALARWLLEEVAPWHVNDRRWLGNVAMELANIRAIVDLIGDAEPEMAQQLMCSVGRYHDTMQSYQTGIDELTRAAAVLTGRSASRVALLTETVDLHLRMANLGVASQLLDEASGLQAEVGPPAWNNVAVDRCRGEIALRSGDYENTIAIAQAALSHGPSERSSARMWSLIGIAESSLGDVEAGLRSLTRALDTYSNLGDAPHIAIAHSNVAEAAWRLNFLVQAATHQRDSLVESLAIGQWLGVASSLIMASRFATLRERWEDAIRMQSHAQFMLQQARHEPYQDEADAIRATTQEAQQHLGEAAVSDLQEAGYQLDVIDASDLALETFDREIATEAHGELQNKRNTRTQPTGVS